MTGPYETDRRVRELPAVRAIYDAMYASHRRGVMGELGYRLLDEACEAASVKVGAYDHRILIWLAGFEPETCAVVAALLSRAQAAGSARPPGSVLLTAAEAASARRALAGASAWRACRAGARAAGNAGGSTQVAAPRTLSDEAQAASHDCLLRRLGGQEAVEAPGERDDPAGDDDTQARFAAGHGGSAW